jgi:alcohol dehydrogenase class IV
MAEGIALEGMKLIKNSLLTAFNDGKNLEARRNLLAASSMGSTAFQKGLGAIHSLSHPVNAQFDIHHGLSNAIFMPYVLTFNKSSIEKKIVSICDYLDLEKSFYSFLEWILDLRSKLNIPNRLSDVMDCSDLNLDELSIMAFDDPSTSGNPKKISREDLKLMYEHSISGELFR